MNMRFFILLSILAPIYCVASGRPQTITDSIPDQWLYSSSYTQSLPCDDEWWKTFNDSKLDSLINLGIDRNYNVAIAMRRIAVARQAQRQVKAGYYPTLGLSAGWNKSRTSRNLTDVTTPANDVSYYSATVDMSWEIDLFGRINSAVAQKKAQWQASRADYVATMISLCSDIASGYIQLRTLQSRLAVAERHLESQGKVLAIARARHEAGLASKLDVAQAATIYYSTEASLPTLHSAIASAINSIATLTGDFPHNIAPALEAKGNIPDYKRLISIGVPVDLIRRRPDMVAAEADIAAAAASVGIAKKDFLPTLSVEGSIGWQAHDAGKWFNSNSLTYNIAPKLSWTIFDGMARNAALATAKENMLISIDNYNQTLLTAVQEVESAMQTYTCTMKSIAYYQKVVAQAEEAFRLSIDLYKQGLSDFTNVADAQMNFLQYSDALTEAEGQAATQLINLYRALGGGWDINRIK